MSTSLALFDWQKHSDLLAGPTLEHLRQLPSELIHGVTKNDAALADTYIWAEQFSVPLDQTANVVIVETRITRGAERKLAAVLVLADSRADLNGSAKRALGSAKVSFAPTARAEQELCMESGGMSPIGLPSDVPLLVDERVLSVKKLYLGSGLRHSKLVVDGRIFREFANTTIAEGIATITEQE